MRIDKLNILSAEYVLKYGTYFDDDMYWSEEFEDQLCSKDGVPFEGLLYETYKNGDLAYYCFYKNGIKDGIFVKFYPSGKINRYVVFNNGIPKLKSYEWYENGKVKHIKNHYKNDYHYKFVTYDTEGNIIEQGEV